jgi:hypothetical protein
MGEEMPKNENVFSDVEKSRMLADARINEERQRAMTGGDASEDTQEIFDEEERQRVISDANPENPAQYEVDEKKKVTRENEVAREAIAKMRAMLLAKEPERPDYDHPPTSKK